MVCPLQMQSTEFCKYVRNKWNIFDHVMYILLLMAVLLRFTLTDERDFRWARNVYAVDLVMFYLRILQLYLLHRPVGPKIIMIWRMVCDVSSAFVVYSLCFSGISN